MQIFIDTANIEEIKKYAKIGIINGVTTNPALVAKEGRDFKQVVEEIGLLFSVSLYKYYANLIILEFNR